MLSQLQGSNLRSLDTKNGAQNLSAVFTYYIVGYSATTAQFSEAKRW